MAWNIEGDIEDDSSGSFNDQLLNSDWLDTPREH